MGVIYESAKEIPYVGAHDDAARSTLEIYGNELQDEEGLLIVGSYANSAHNLRSDLDYFVFSSDPKRAERLKSLQQFIVPREVNIEAHIETLQPGKYITGEVLTASYYNHIRVSPRVHQNGTTLLVGDDPVTVLGPELNIDTPATAQDFLKERKQKMLSILAKTGEFPQANIDYQRALEMPGKLALRIELLAAAGYDMDGCRHAIYNSGAFNELLHFDARMTHLVAALSEGATDEDQYLTIINALRSHAIKAGYLAMSATVAELELLKNQPNTPKVVSPSANQAAREKVYTAIHRRGRGDNAPEILFSV